MIANVSPPGDVPKIPQGHLVKESFSQTQNHGTQIPLMWLLSQPNAIYFTYNQISKEKLKYRCIKMIPVLGTFQHRHYVWED